MELVRMADLRRIERPSEEADRFVVHLERHWERMSILAAVGKREARRIGEPCRCAMDDLRNERERLEGARSELFQEEKRREVADIALVGERQDRAESPLVHIRPADI